MFLSREDILKTCDIVEDIKIVEVPEWKGSVKIRVMTGREREIFEEAVNAKVSQYNLRARLAVVSICDDNGRQVFSKADVEALAAKSSKALQRIYEAALSHNGLTKEAVKTLEKNSEPATSGDTPSESLEGSESPTSTD